MPGRDTNQAQGSSAAGAVGLAAFGAAAWAASTFVLSSAPRNNLSLRASARRSGGTLADPQSSPAPASSSAVAGLGVCSIGMMTFLAARQQKRTPRMHRRAAPEQEPEIDPRRQDPPPQVPPVRMPMIDTGSGEKLDVMSKLLQDRIIILGGEVKDEMAQVLVAQMLYLANESNEDITMYINSPGGSVSAGMAIYDTMQFIPCEISTVCFGMAASMGSFLLAAGTKGKRKSLPNSRIMIHQPLGGAQGQASDVRIQAREILHMREILNMHLADATGKSMEQIAKDCDRDNFMTPEEAKEYGLIDDIVPTKAWPRIQKPARPGLA